MWLKAQDNPNYKISEKGSYKWNRNIGKELEIQEREMPENKKLLQQCFNDVKSSRGLI
jgi:hypothetical protein